mmetsp:Transcript_29157/g.49214  ORF Transcript_29157/g.49214 Transcript_29157/m.49214 type:complete len:136 (+) Transcript_29157:79-486(+)
MDENDSDRMEVVEPSENLVGPKTSPLNILPPPVPSTEPVASNDNNVESVPMQTGSAQDLVSDMASASREGCVEKSTEDVGVMEDKSAGDIPHTTPELNASDSFIAMQKGKGDETAAQEQPPSEKQSEPDLLDQQA